MADASFEAEEHFDEYEHYNYDQDKAMLSGHSGRVGKYRLFEEFYMI